MVEIIPLSAPWLSLLAQGPHAMVIDLTLGLPDISISISEIRRCMSGLGNQSHSVTHT